MIKHAGGEATSNYDSVATPEGGQNIIQTAVNAYGKIDILVHVAGILRDRMIFNMSIEEWDAVINVHCVGRSAWRSPPVCSCDAEEWLHHQLSRRSQQRGTPGKRTTRRPRRAFLGLTRTIARDMAKYGVRANCHLAGGQYAHDCHRA